MSSTSQLTTFSDLYTDLLQRMRLNTSVAGSIEQAKRYVNIALHDIHLGFDYKLPWCEDSSIIRTKTPYTTGTISTSLGSATLTGSGTAWNTANSYGETNTKLTGKFIFEGEAEVYKVNAVTNDTSITLTQSYSGEAALSGATYTYFEDQYALHSSFLRPIDFQMFSPALGIQLISRAEFRRRFPIVQTSGRPRVACLIDTYASSTNQSPLRLVQFYPYPDKVYLIPYSFVTSRIAVSSSGSTLTSMSADTDVPTMPLRYRHAIVYHAMYHWYRDRKDDGRSESAKADYADIMMRIVADHDIATHTKAQIQPNVGGYIGSALSPYSKRSGKMTYDLNDEWDSFKR